MHLLFTPTTPTPAFELGAKSDPYEMYLSDIFTATANLAGVPAMSLPIGASTGCRSAASSSRRTSTSGTMFVARLRARARARRRRRTDERRTLPSGCDEVRDGRRARGARASQDAHEGLLQLLAPTSARRRTRTPVRCASRCPVRCPVLNERRRRARRARGASRSAARCNETSIFARKNYFYPDLPKGYQISQFDKPLAPSRASSTSARTPTARRSRIGVTRVHMEEDAGKSVHDRYPGATAIDLNRSGVPLVEIVSEPDMRSAARGGRVSARAQADARVRRA